MKALTDRQAAALETLKQGGTVDKGMLKALANKGYDVGVTTEVNTPVVPNEKYVIYSPADNNRMVRVRGNGAGVLKDAIYATRGAAKAALTRMKGKAVQARLEGKRVPHLVEGVEQFVLLPMSEYLALNRTVTRKNFMTGEEFQEDVNTPYYCSPSSETYWSS